jgi:hypothetical protein
VPPVVSEEMNASSSSFAAAVANEGDAIVVAEVPRSVELVTSIAIPVEAVLVRAKLAEVATPDTDAATL